MLIKTVDKFLYFLFGAFDDNFNAAIREVTDPAVYARLLGEPLSRKTKTDTVNNA